MSNKPQIHYSPTDYGFEWGSMQVIRYESEPKRGIVIIQIQTPKKIIQVYATKTGKIRIFGNREWKEINP